MIGRNDLCPCNSGKKYKHCCGKVEWHRTPSPHVHGISVPQSMPAVPNNGKESLDSNEPRTTVAPAQNAPRPPLVWELLDSDLHMHTLKQDYAPVGLLEFVASPPRKILDVGCFCGGSGRWLKNKFPDCEVIGIELLDEAAAIAARTYGRVIIGAFEQIDFDAEGLAPGTIDAIIAADVLEHLYNPWKALQRLKPLLAPGGALYVSLPNVRNLRVLAALARGEWQYTGAGILDITHIRFFTRAQAIQMLEQTGWHIDHLGINYDSSLVPMLQGNEMSQIRSIDAGQLKLENLTQEDVVELLALQFFIRAVPGGSQPT